MLKTKSDELNKGTKGNVSQNITVKASRLQITILQSTAWKSNGIHALYIREQQKPTPPLSIREPIGTGAKQRR